MIFSNIADLQDMTIRFLGLLEDTVEMYRESGPAAVGSCFLEMAEVCHCQERTRKGHRSICPSGPGHPPEFFWKCHVPVRCIQLNRKSISRDVHTGSPAVLVI